MSSLRSQKAALGNVIEAHKRALKAITNEIVKCDKKIQEIEAKKVEHNQTKNYYETEISRTEEKLAEITGETTETTTTTGTTT